MTSPSPNPTTLPVIPAPLSLSSFPRKREPTLAAGLPLPSSPRKRGSSAVNERLVVDLGSLREAAPGLGPAAELLLCFAKEVIKVAKRGGLTWRSQVSLHQRRPGV